MDTMRALKTFKQAETGQTIRPGMEFATSNAKHYEKRGFAVKVTALAPMPADKLKNEAANTGPFDSPGGRTGAGKQPSSSPADRAPKTQRSEKSAGAVASSRSMKDTGSAPPLTSSTLATGHGGASEAASRNSQD